MNDRKMLLEVAAAAGFALVVLSYFAGQYRQSVHWIAWTIATAGASQQL